MLDLLRDLIQIGLVVLALYWTIRLAIRDELKSGVFVAIKVSEKEARK